MLAAILEVTASLRPFNSNVSSCKLASARTVVIDFNCGDSRVIESESLQGKICFSSALPQYLIKAMLIGASTEISSGACIN